MTNDIFYATLKLVTGEEIISKICAFIEDDEVLILLDNPTLINIFDVNNVKNVFVKMTPWISSSSQTTHIINRNHVITINEIKDIALVRLYNHYIKEKGNKTNQTNITSEMGYISSIEDARSSLEKMYHSKEYDKKID
jgi:hypothetical protein